MPDHPCGNLPETYTTFTVNYCHHHQAFWIHSATIQQLGGDGEPVTVHDSWKREFGPFDDHRDVAAVLASEVPRGLKRMMRHVTEL